MKRSFIVLLVFLCLFSMYAQERVSFKIPVLAVRKDIYGSCNRIEFEYANTGKKLPLYIGYREDTPAGTGEVIKGSLWLAGITAALQRNSPMNGVEITINFKDYTDGPSAGGIICLAILTAMDGRSIPPDFAMTGTIMPDGTIGMVGGIQYKLQAAAKENLKRVCVPFGKRFEFDKNGHEVDLDRIARDLGIELFYVKNVQEAYCVMHNLPFPHEEYLSDRGITKLPYAIEMAAEEIYTSGYNICADGTEKLFQGKSDKEIKEIKQDNLWQFLDISDSRRLRHAGNFLLAIKKLKLPVAAWGTFPDSIERLSKIEKRYPNYQKDKNEKVAFIIDLSDNIADTFLSKYFIKRVKEKFTDLEQNYLQEVLMQDYYGDGIKPENPQNDIPAQLEDVNRFSQSVKFVKLFLGKIPNKETLMKLEHKELDDLIKLQQFRFFTAPILGRLDAINRTYLKKLSRALPQMSANSEVDMVEHLFFATGMAACKMFETDDLPALTRAIKQNVKSSKKGGTQKQKISDEDAIALLANSDTLFLSWQFAKDDSTLIHWNKKYTDYKSYHSVAAIKSHILLFTQAHALMVKTNRGNDISSLIDCARQQAIFNVTECQKRNIPCLQAIIYFEAAEINRDNPRMDRVEGVLVNYWNSSLIAKALVMSFSRQANSTAVLPATKEENAQYLMQASQCLKNGKFQEAYALLAKADQNDSEVRYLLGVMCFDGKTYGIKENIPLAVEHLQFATASGKNEAYYDLGLCLLRVDISKAVAAFQMGADTGNAQCQYYLGKIYWQGLGVKANPVLAKLWFKKAADQGFAPAMSAYETISREY